MPKMNWITNLKSVFAHALGSLFQDCQHASRLQSEALDHRLTPLQRVGLRCHLALCKWCRRYGEQIRFLRVAARRFGEAPIDSGAGGLSAEARKRILEKLQSGEE